MLGAYGPDYIIMIEMMPDIRFLAMIVGNISRFIYVSEQEYAKNENCRRYLLLIRAVLGPVECSFKS
jgi:hypothetical protein